MAAIIRYCSIAVLLLANVASWIDSTIAQSFFYDYMTYEIFNDPQCQQSIVKPPMNVLDTPLTVFVPQYSNCVTVTNNSFYKGVDGVCKRSLNGEISAFIDYFPINSSTTDPCGIVNSADLTGFGYGVVRFVDANATAANNSCIPGFRTHKELNTTSWKPYIAQTPIYLKYSCWSDGHSNASSPQQASAHWLILLLLSLASLTLLNLGFLDLQHVVIAIVLLIAPVTAAKQVQAPECCELDCGTVGGVASKSTYWSDTAYTVFGTCYTIQNLYWYNDLDRHLISEISTQYNTLKPTPYHGLQYGSYESMVVGNNIIKVIVYWTNSGYELGINGFTLFDDNSQEYNIGYTHWGTNITTFTPPKGSSFGVLQGWAGADLYQLGFYAYQEKSGACVPTPFACQS